jgi:glycosyltransferase involved in cell wall biosynthesis
MSINKTITILCPVFNESENIENFYKVFHNHVQLLKDYRFNFIFADNHSTDDSFSIIQRLSANNNNISGMRFSKNFGYMKSIYTGFINSKGDACVVFDCDLQDPPTLINEFLAAWESGFKVIYGERVTRIESSYLGFFRRAYRVFENFIKGYEVKIESGTWFLDKRVIDEMRKLQFDPYLPGLISRLGFSAIGIPYNRRSREKGRAKGNTLIYLAYARDGIVSGTITPLRLMVVFGVFVALMSFILMFILLIAKIFMSAPFASGVAALSAITLCGFGINFIFLGVLGEYVGRIYMEKESRQPAIIEETCGSNFA